MLMVHYLQRFLFRWKYVVLISLIISATVVTFCFQINRWLPDYALSFSHLIDQQFQTKTSFRTAYYRFPNYIVFKNVNVFGFNDKSPMLQASRVTLGISFPLFSSAVPFHSMVIDGMAIHFPLLKKYLTPHGKKIYAWAKRLPQGKMHLHVPHGRFYPADAKKDPVSFKIDLNLDQNHLSAAGFWGDNDRYNYELYGDIRDSGFDMDKLTVKDDQSSLNLWGSWHSNNIDWNGFIFYNKFYILDIDGHVKIQEKDIVLKQLSFSLNGDDVSASGNCLKQNLFQCDTDLTYQRQAQHINFQEPLKNIDLHLHARNTPQGVLFKGGADFYFLFNPDSPTSLQNAHLNFKNLTAQFVNDNFLKLKIKKMQSIFSIHGNQYMVPLENLLVSFHFAQPYEKAIALSANIYAGNLHSRIFLNTASLPWQIKGQGKFKKIDMDQLSNTFASFKQCHGVLAGNFNLQASKDIQLIGTLVLHNGHFDNSNFQKWMAKTLQMPSLRDVSNADLSGHFKIDGKSRMLDDLKMKTDDFDLNGFFHLDADDLVSAQGSVRFSKKLLSESPIGRHVIGLVRGAWTLPFDFSLSGNMYRMNFQWDNSPLKDKVHHHMFSFIERMIDRRLDAHPYNVTMPNESVSPG